MDLNGELASRLACGSGSDGFEVEHRFAKGIFLSNLSENNVYS